MEIIRTICNVGGCYKQLHVVDSASPEKDMQHYCHLQCLEFTNKLDVSIITPSPITVRYYTNQITIKSSSTSTIPVQVQLDGGANGSITNNPTNLTRYQLTPDYAIYGVNKDDVALTCTATGYIPWAADNGDIVYVPCYYSPDAAEKIISPTDVVMSHLYTAWGQFAHVPTGQGHITFYRNGGTNHTTFSHRMQNGNLEEIQQKTLQSTQEEPEGRQDRKAWTYATKRYAASRVPLTRMQAGQYVRWFQ
jgi:hypothetical protein